jgi:hypothetical protein
VSGCCCLSVSQSWCLECHSCDDIKSAVTVTASGCAALARLPGGSACLLAVRQTSTSGPSSGPSTSTSGSGSTSGRPAVSHQAVHGNSSTWLAAAHRPPACGPMAAGQLALTGRTDVMLPRRRPAGAFAATRCHNLTHRRWASQPPLVQADGTEAAQLEQLIEKGRQRIASGLYMHELDADSHSQTQRLLKAANELLEIKGVGHENAKKLMKAGVGSVKELREMLKRKKFLGDKQGAIGYLKKEVGIRHVNHAESIWEQVREQEQRPVTMCVEGNISVGKTTFLHSVCETSDNMKERVCSCAHLQCIVLLLSLPPHTRSQRAKRRPYDDTQVGVRTTRRYAWYQNPSTTGRMCKTVDTTYSRRSTKILKSGPTHSRWVPALLQLVVGH